MFIKCDCNEKVKTVELKFKESFKKISLYNDGYVFVSELEPHILNDEIASLCEVILNNEYKVRIKSGDMSTSLVFESGTSSNTTSVPYRAYKFGDLGNSMNQEISSLFKTIYINSIRIIIFAG